MAIVAVAVAGCGGGTKAGSTQTSTVTVTSTGGGGASSGGTTHTAHGMAQAPSPDDAQQYARHTYVVQPQLGKRVFKVFGPAQSVTAGDGSLITAFSAVLADSGDGTGQAVLLFRGTKFLGWASNRLAIRLTIGRSGDQIAVKYGNFQGNDPLCCPSSMKTVDYSWNGSRIVADGDPPLAYGKPGDELRLAPGG